MIYEFHISFLFLYKYIADKRKEGIMSIASVNGLVLSLTEEKSMLEEQRMVIDQRRQTLAFHSAYLYDEYSQKLQQKNTETVSVTNKDGDEAEAEVETEISEQEWNDFFAEYQIATSKLDNQDKFMEMERNNIQTKLDAITTSLESAEKRLNKNIESEMKSFS